MELWVLALNSQTETALKNLRTGTARRWNYTFLNTDTTNPCTNGASLIHLVPKKPGMVIWSWKVVMQSLHNMERFMEWLTCYRRTQSPILVLAVNAKETLKHILDFSSLVFEVKHGPKCSAGLGPICWTTMIKKKIPSKFLIYDICVKMLGFKWEFMMNFVSVLFPSLPHYETTLSGIREKKLVYSDENSFCFFEKNPWGTAPSFRWQKRDTAFGMSTVGRGEIK